MTADNLQYAELFLTESRENVAAVNQALLQLERDGANGGASPAVGAIFRAVHTIKGMGATMGYAIVAELAHELETVLDRIRRGDLDVDPPVMDVLFRSADVLEQAVEASVAGREGAVIATELVEKLREMGADGAAPTGWTAPAPTTPGTLVRVRFTADTPLRGVRAFMILQSLAKVGEVTGTEPSSDALQFESTFADFALRILSPTPSDEIEKTIRAAGDVDEVQIGDDKPAPRRDSESRPATEASSAIIPNDERVDSPKSRFIRIDVRRLDTLMNLVGELVIARGRLAQIAGDLGNKELTETVDQSTRLITELRGEITATRMVPVAQIFDRFPRVVRDAARSVGKQIDFAVEGKEIELDRSMLDDIADSIVHLLRNAIDHGIEVPAERIASGKSATGKLVLSAARDRSAVVIKVSDDGRGIDRKRVLARAKRDGLVDAAKNDLTEDELLWLLARPGFSTAEKVTDLSGRGVGVDAVHTRVRALGGAMDIRSEPGEGTTMMLKLPLTLAIVRALLAKVANETYAIPLAHVSDTIEVTPEIVKTVKGREVLLARDEVLPLHRMRELVDLPAYVAPSDIALEQAVVIDVGDRRAALVVDELSGQEEIVVKQYDAVRDSLPLFGGATLLGDGTPSLIVDVSSLL